MQDHPFAPPPPIPADHAEARRVEHTRLRRRMLYGLWREDLLERMKLAMGTTRTDVVGEPDLSSNAFAATCAASSALYDRTPKITHADGDQVVAAMGALVRGGGLWAQMQRTMRDVLGLREVFVRVEVFADPTNPAAVEVTYRPVYPDMVVARPDPERPERPAEVREMVMRTRPVDNRLVWTWEVWSLLGPEPRHHIVSAEAGDNGLDVSALYGLPEGGLVGDAYPARRADRAPVLPYVLHHAARTGCLFDAWHGLEVVEGTLNVGVLWTFFAHCVRNASWPQRWTIGVQPAGSGSEGAAGKERPAIVADPTFVLDLRPVEGEGQGQGTAGQWAAAADPQTLSEAIGTYERRLAAFAGLDPSDIQRVSGDPRSGYAIAISREGRRESQRRYAPIFQPADEEILSVTAVLVNRAIKSELLPEDGWGVEYEALPATPEELQAQQVRVLSLLQAGLIDHTQARRMLGLDKQ